MKKINQHILDNAHKLSTNNKNKLKEINSCYFCLNYIKLETITDWADKGQTALCSFCGIDSLIPGEIDSATLEACLEKWFTGAKDD
jgi:transcription elongation factor Elf1